ncbi:MAG: hypothetical protein V9G12_13805 [Microthrixaceae bacterium]
MSVSPWNVTAPVARIVARRRSPCSSNIWNDTSTITMPMLRSMLPRRGRLNC